MADERKRRGTDGWRFRHELLREVAADVLTAPTTRRRKPPCRRGSEGGRQLHACWRGDRSNGG